MKTKPQDQQEQMHAAQDLIKKLKKEKREREEKLKLKLEED